MNKTITEIMEFLDDDGERPSAGLREFMYEKVGDLAEHWYRRGFNRGHMQSYKEFEDTDAVPKKLTFRCGGKRLCPRNERDLVLKSSIKEKGKKKKVIRKG